MMLSAMTIANALTLLRLCLIPLIVVLIHEASFALATVAFITAGLTDALDGYIARRFNQRTEIGAYLDALADKSLIAASFIALVYVQLVPFWLVVLVIFRDLMIVGAVAIAWLMQNPIAIEPLKVSKANTAAQIVAVAATLAIKGFALAPDALVLPFLHFTVAALTVLSVTAYFARWFRHMSG
ncbi:MAG: CDP-alcohol phosphatidyltransferase family protein [Proteobacteria bacterium]|nr:CDP-alcohol phosphatidyltransferase family protein [Pseudomonadota bacterium]